MFQLIYQIEHGEISQDFESSSEILDVCEINGGLTQFCVLDLRHSLWKMIEYSVNIKRRQVQLFSKVKYFPPKCQNFKIFLFPFSFDVQFRNVCFKSFEAVRRNDDSEAVQKYRNESPKFWRQILVLEVNLKNSGVFFTQCLKILKTMFIENL